MNFSLAAEKTENFNHGQPAIARLDRGGRDQQLKAGLR